MADDQGMLAALDRDWQDIGDEHAPATWLAILPARALSRGASLSHLNQLLRRRDDGLATALVVLAQAGEQLAGRVLVQALLPRLWRIARRDARHDLADYVYAAWTVIMTFPAGTRTSAVLVNLGLDCLKALTRGSRNDHREVPVQNLNTNASPLADAPPLWGAYPADERRAYVRDLVRLAATTGIVSPTCAGVMRSVYCDGLTGREAARRHAISQNMVRYYCATAKKALRASRVQLTRSLGTP